MTNIEILSAIPSTEPADFREFLRGLPEVPSDRAQWADLLRAISHLQSIGLIEVERSDLNGNIESLLLTNAGVATVRRANGQSR